MRAEPGPLELEDVPRLVLAALPVVLLTGVFVWGVSSAGWCLGCGGITFSDPSAAAAYQTQMREDFGAIVYLTIAFVVVAVLTAGIYQDRGAP